jgi:hypothetical protein
MAKVFISSLNLEIKCLVEAICVIIIIMRIIHFSIEIHMLRANKNELVG